jgi:hypothetical protein
LVFKNKKFFFPSALKLAQIIPIKIILFVKVAIRNVMDVLIKINVFIVAFSILGKFSLEMPLIYVNVMKITLK